MTHRKYSRTRKEIHRGMARNPGQRKSKAARLEQAAKDRDSITGDHLGAILLKEHRERVREEEIRRTNTPPAEKSVTKRPGFLKRIFQRKTI